MTETGRPHAVPGPLGVPLTLETLPPPETTRWVVRRKAEVLAAINGGLLTAAEACARYRLSPEELELWQEAVDRAGVPGLRVTRIQLYRELDRRNAARRRETEARPGPVGVAWQA
ncbi:CtrA inhibitor SciP [Thermaurantiacus sp.]